jgi:hypothetical protein
MSEPFDSLYSREALVLLEKEFGPDPLNPCADLAHVIHGIEKRIAEATLHLSFLRRRQMNAVNTVLSDELFNSVLCTYLIISPTEDQIVNVKKEIKFLKQQRGHAYAALDRFADLICEAR